MIRHIPSVAAIAVALAALSGCEGAPERPEAEETEVPDELAQGGVSALEGETEGIGTPMAERVATIGLLNKRNNISREFELSPGDSVRAGDVVIRLSACEKTAPWELPQEEAGFAQVFVRDAQAEDEDQWRKVFSGWLFRNSPSLNVVEHPIYDVWLKECAMSFPGETS